MNIHQMQLTYSFLEDRIVMKVNNKDKEEVQLFLTRRILISFWDILNHTIEHILNNDLKLDDTQEKSAAQKQITPQQVEIKQQMKNQVYHQNIIDVGDYKTPFSQADSFPAGEDPILPETITITAYNNGNVKLIFEVPEKENIEFNLSSESLHNLSNLLIKVLPTTEWNINLTDKSSVIVHEDRKNTELH